MKVNTRWPSHSRSSKGFRHNLSDGHVTNLNQGYLTEALLALHGDLGVLQHACEPKAAAPPTIFWKFRAALGIALHEIKALYICLIGHTYSMTRPQWVYTVLFAAAFLKSILRCAPESVPLGDFKQGPPLSTHWGPHLLDFLVFFACSVDFAVFSMLFQVCFNRDIDFSIKKSILRSKTKIVKIRKKIEFGISKNWFSIAKMV